MSDYSDEHQATLPARLPDETSKGSAAERRTVPRYPFTAAAEVIDLRSKARVVGRSSDLGLGGCYVDTISPFPVGAYVSVRLDHNQCKFEAVAVVIYALASMGMGISFTEIKPEQRAVLQAWVAELSGEAPAIPEPPAVSEPPRISDTADTPTEDDPLNTISNVRQVMNEFINLMIRKKIITEKEGAGLLRQLFQ